MAKKKHTLLIGDVHGCIDELKDLLAKASYHPEMRLIFVGDLINKGPDSAAVLSLAEQLKAEVVLGNHERSFVRYIEKERTDKPDFEDIRKQMGKRLTYWVNWINALPNYIEDDNFLVVHAGLEPDKHPAQSSERILTQIRTWDGTGTNLNNPTDPPWFDLYTHNRLVVFGHWALKGLVVKPNIIGLDTGCVYGNELTGLLLPERRLIQVKARKIWRVPGT